jgi:hypothetical protein
MNFCNEQSLLVLPAGEHLMLLVGCRIISMPLVRSKIGQRAALRLALPYNFVELAVLAIDFALLVCASVLAGIGCHRTRCASFSFFILGVSSLLLWRGILAALISKALENGAFAKRKIVVIGEDSNLLSSCALPALQRCGYRPVSVFALSKPDHTTTGMPETLLETLDCAIKTARQDTAQDIFLMISWAHSRCIEDIVDVLTFQ